MPIVSELEERINRLAEPSGTILGRFDRWMAAHVWHPRITPFFVYITLLAVITFVEPSVPWLYPPLYVLQCAVVLWLLWRYRKLTPELTLKFHWLAVPVGVFVAAAWIALGWAMSGEFGRRWEALAAGDPIGMIPYTGGGINRPYFATDAADVETFIDTMGPTYGWVALSLRLLGMSLVVPLFEELFIRSLMLRTLSSARGTWLGVKQVMCDVPLIGEWFMHTKVGERATRQPPAFSPMFKSTPLGKLTVFGVFASTFVFMLSHTPRDWPSIWVCGVAYCLLLAATARKGLGPVVWAHGITNALLWAYTVWTWDWQFL